jgi:hypothetical protein
MDDKEKPCALSYNNISFLYIYMDDKEKPCALSYNNISFLLKETYIIV